MATKAGQSPSTYSPSILKSKQQRPRRNDLARPDGRGFHQCRPAFLKTGAVNAAAGSAYAEFGNTKVIVSVFGPRESKKAMYSDVGRLNCNVTYATFATSSRGQGSDHKEYSSMLHQALEGSIILDSFPKTTVDIFALVLESGGSHDILTLLSQEYGLSPSYPPHTLLVGCTGYDDDDDNIAVLAYCDLPVVISCASLALADAGIMMYDLVASVSVSSMGPNLIIDPVSEEESHQDGSLVFTCMTSRNDVTQLVVTGEWSTPKMNEAMELCFDACNKLGGIMRSCLKQVSDA